MTNREVMNREVLSRDVTNREMLSHEMLSSEMLGREVMRSEATVVPVSCLKDNYAYLIFDPRGDGRCIVVDPSEPEPVRAELKKRGLALAAILSTHHHPDHTGGNRALAEGGQVEVIAHESEKGRIPAMTRGVAHRETFELLGLSISVLHNPGHTRGGVTYILGERCFVGDTLFCGGCGRLKEGTAFELYASLNEVLSELPGDFLFYCGHEYTQKNLEFARQIWDHPELEARYVDVVQKRSAGHFCASATFAEERRTNPFLLCHRSEVQEALGCSDALATFTELRLRKDRS